MWHDGRKNAWQHTKQQLDRKNCGRHACSICCGNMCSGSHFCALAGSPMHVCEISMHDMSSHENNPLDMQPHGHDYIQSLDWQTHPARHSTWVCLGHEQGNSFFFGHMLTCSEGSSAVETVHGNLCETCRVVVRNFNNFEIKGICQIGSSLPPLQPGVKPQEASATSDISIKN